MSQDNKKSFVMYQGDGSNNVFSVPMTKGKFGTISVAFVRRGLDQYEYNPTTFTLNSDNTLLTWTGTTLNIGDYIVIERKTVREQPFEYQNNQKHLEKSDDNLERQIQEVADKVDNALLVDPTHTIDSNKMTPLQWMATILRSVDSSVRGFKYVDGMLYYSVDDPNAAEGSKTWTAVLNTINVTTIRVYNNVLQYSVDGGGTWVPVAAKWGAIGGNINDQTDLKNALDAKQNTISDLATIRSGAAKGATAVQPGDDISELTNDAGYITGITSSMVITALGYTPYSSANPNGYQANVIESVKVNGTALSITGKAVDIPVPTKVSDLTNDTGYITGISSSMVITALGYTPVNPTSLATVATTGQYSDLSGKPTIPTTLAGLTGDVSISSPTNGQSLQYDATLSKWKNVSSTASIGFDGITGSPEDNVALKNALDLKADVATTCTKTEVNTALSGKANTGMDNLTATGKNISNWSSNVSSCITEIPQDINLELNNGTLTLKAGSKVYVPNGAGVFDVINITTDRSNSGNTMKAFAVTNGSSFFWSPTVSSGGTAPANPVNGQIWYDTTNNVVKRYSIDSGTWVGGFSLPVALLNPNATTVTTVTEMQVFNGAGYIGHHAFVLPGVGGLLPNRRNSDGTLNNTARNNNTVTVVEMNTGTYNGYTRTISLIAGNPVANTAGYVEINDRSQAVSTAWVRQYVASENIIIARTSDNGPFVEFTGGVYPQQTPFIFYNYDGTSVTKFDIKTPFRAVDYNDFANLSNEVVRTSGDQTISGTKTFTGNNTFTGSNEFKQTVKAPSVYGYGSDNVRTASLEFIDGGNDNIARLVAVSNNGNNAATADLHFNNGSPYFAVPSSDAVNAAVATLAKTKAQSGYFKLSNGLIIQWLNNQLIAQNAAITLPTPFSSATSYSAIAVHIGTTEIAYPYTTREQTSTTVSFNRYTGMGGDERANIIAIGY